MKRRLIGVMCMIGLYMIGMFFPEPTISMVFTWIFSLGIGISLVYFIYPLKNQLGDTTYWWLHMTMLLCQLVWVVVGAVRELLLGMPTDCLLGDVALAGIPICLTISIWQQSLKKESIKTIGRRLLQSIAFISSLLYLMYLVFFQNVQSQTELYTDATVIRIFLLLDVVLMASLVLSFFLTAADTIGRKHILVKAVGVIAYTLADMLYLTVVFVEGEVFYRLMEVLWTAGICLIIFSLYVEVKERNGRLRRGNKILSKEYNFIANCVGLLALIVIGSLELAIEDKSLVVLLLVIAYMYVSQIDSYLQKHQLERLNVRLADQVEQINQLNDQLVANNRQLEDITRIDFLTKLGNRRAFEVAFETFVAAVEQKEMNGFGLLMIDLNRFKTVNDTYGHAVGDEVIKSVADRLQRAVTTSCVVARQGGDEFVILVPDVATVDELVTVTDGILQQVPGMVCLKNHLLELALSMGAAIYPVDGANQDQLMKRADHAMYGAKKAGDNQVLFAN